MPDERLPTFLIGALVGVLLGAVLVAGAGAWLFPTENVASPSGSMTTATGCRANASESGWVGHVVVGDHAVVVFNYTLVHDATDLDVRSSVPERVAEGRYVYAITTSPVTDGRKGAPPAGCQPRTTIDAAVTLPRDFGTLSMTLDGRTVVTVRSEPATGPAFRVVNGSSVG